MHYDKKNKILKRHVFSLKLFSVAKQINKNKFIFIKINTIIVTKIWLIVKLN